MIYINEKVALHWKGTLWLDESVNPRLFTPYLLGLSVIAIFYYVEQVPLNKVVINPKNCIPAFKNAQQFKFLLREQMSHYLCQKKSPTCL